jgi:hypothetical protein
VKQNCNTYFLNHYIISDRWQLYAGVRGQADSSYRTQAIKCSRWHKTASAVSYLLRLISDSLSKRVQIAI